MNRWLPALAAIALAACIAPESRNPAPRCTSNVECSAGTHCYRSFCVLDDDVLDAGPSCEDGASSCDRDCVDLSTDDDHCGTCENKCGRHTHCLERSCVEDP